MHQKGQYFIPLGLLFGAAAGILLSLFWDRLSQSMLLAIGAAIGLLVGIIASAFTRNN